MGTGHDGRGGRFKPGREQDHAVHKNFAECRDVPAVPRELGWNMTKGVTIGLLLVVIPLLDRRVRQRQCPQALAIVVLAADDRHNRLGIVRAARRCPPPSRQPGGPWSSAQRQRTTIRLVIELSPPPGGMGLWEISRISQVPQQGGMADGRRISPSIRSGV